MTWLSRGGALDAYINVFDLREFGRSNWPADIFFLNINTDTGAHIYTHTLTLWTHTRNPTPMSTPWDLRSHRRRLVVDGNVSSHWMRIAGNPEINSEINASRIWTLMDWGYHSTSNHPTTNWFAARRHIKGWCWRAQRPSGRDVYGDKRRRCA